MISSYLDQVAEFHRCFKYKQPEPTQPDFTDPATNALRPRLIAEELHELRHAIAENDRLEQLDALCDSQYVHSGAVLAWGLRTAFDAPSITMDLRKVRNMDAHLAEMFGLNAQLEIAAETGHAAIAVMHLRKMQSRLSQLVWSLGFSPVFDAAFAEVHRSNMSKIFIGYNENDSITDHGMTCTLVPTEGGHICKRSDGKIVKPDSYSPASLAQFIQ